MLTEFVAKTLTVTNTIKPDIPVTTDESLGAGFFGSAGALFDVNGG
jgi:hypothetical protein